MLAVALLAGVMSGPVVPAGAGPAPGPLLIGSNPPGTLFYSVASGVAKLVADHAGMQAVVQPYAGSSTFLPLLNTGEITFGVVNAVDMAMAYRGPERLKIGGRNPFQLTPNVRLVWRGGPLYLVEWVRRDSPFRTIADLRGRRVTGVYSAHLAVWFNQFGLLASCGLTWDDVRVVPVSTVTEGIDALQEGRADAAPFALGAAKLHEVNAAIGIRGLSICADDEGKRRLQQAVPGYYPVLLKAGQSVGIVNETWAVAYDIYLATHRDAPNDMIQRVTRVLWEHNRKLWPLHAAFEEWTTRRAADPGVTIPYHPGAIALFKEKGAWPARMDEVQTHLLREAGR
ncbi:MAG: TAXI family TRAP transporter solute-binding subunit [Armatimonadota bacterium]|nr:TAXI family TRAP transporter solute-binding subunit [Armatimonadota bacterium]